MCLGRLGKQIVLKSGRAFEQISFTETIPAEKEIDYPKKQRGTGPSVRRPAPHDSLRNGSKTPCARFTSDLRTVPYGQNAGTYADAVSDIPVNLHRRLVCAGASPADGNILNHLIHRLPV